jgi:hypothetical protein
MESVNSFGLKIVKNGRQAGPALLARLAGVIFLGAIFAGCANYGTIRPDAEFQTVFDNDEILTDYRYYFSGPYYAPYAIIGVHKDYQLNSRFWKPESITAHRLKGWRWWMNSDYSFTFGPEPKAYRIYDQSGRPIGFWYSVWTFTVIQSQPDNQVTIYTPHIHDRHAPAFRPTDK